jgi:hypothetical protein
MYDSIIYLLLTGMIISDSSGPSDNCFVLDGGVKLAAA